MAYSLLDLPTFRSLNEGCEKMLTSSSMWLWIVERRKWTNSKEFACLSAPMFRIITSFPRKFSASHPAPTKWLIGCSLGVCCKDFTQINGLGAQVHPNVTLTLESSFQFYDLISFCRQIFGVSKKFIFEFLRFRILFQNLKFRPKNHFYEIFTLRRVLELKNFHCSRWSIKWWYSLTSNEPDKTGPFVSTCHCLILCYSIRVVSNSSNSKIPKQNKNKKQPN